MMSGSRDRRSTWDLDQNTIEKNNHTKVLQ